MGSLKNAAVAEHVFNKLNAVVVRGERRVGSENGMRDPLYERLVEVEELVDNEAAGQTRLSAKLTVQTGCWLVERCRRGSGV